MFQNMQTLNYNMCYQLDFKLHSYLRMYYDILICGISDFSCNKNLLFYSKTGNFQLLQLLSVNKQINKWKKNNPLQLCLTELTTRTDTNNLVFYLGFKEGTQKEFIDFLKKYNFSLGDSLIDWLIFLMPS